MAKRKFFYCHPFCSTTSSKVIQFSRLTKGGREMKFQRIPPMFVSVHGTSVLYTITVSFLLIFLVFSISGLLTSIHHDYRFKSNSVNQATMNFNGKILYLLFGSENHVFLQVLPEDERKWPLSSLFFQITTNIRFDDPRSLLGRELPGFSLFDSRIVVAGEGTNFTNMPIESAPPPEIFTGEQEAKLQNIESIQTEEKTLPPPVPPPSERKVLIYFSHTRESFLPYLEGVNDPNHAHHSQMNVTKIGDYLKGKLESLGIGTYVEKTDINTILNKKGLSYGKSYEESRKVVEAAIQENKDITYLIDIHRDSQRRNVTTKTINGKNYAKLAFVIGAENPHYEKNLKLATMLHEKLEEKYPGLSRGVIEKSGAATNGKFNQDLSENALLIEFGGVDNTFEELYLSADAFAEVFGEIFWEAEMVSAPENNPANKE